MSLLDHPDLAGLAEINAKSVELRKVYDAAQEDLKDNNKKAERLINKFVREHYPEPPVTFTPEDLETMTGWAFALQEPHRLIEAWMKSMATEFMYSGYRHKGEQFKSPTYPGLQLVLAHGQEVKHLYTGIKRYVKAVDVPVGYIGILENSCSAYGTYMVKWITDKAGSTTWEVEKHYYGTPSTLVAGTLPEILRYVADHYWHGDPYPEREDWD